MGSYAAATLLATVKVPEIASMSKCIVKCMSRRMPNMRCGNRFTNIWKFRWCHYHWQVLQRQNAFVNVFCTGDDVKDPKCVCMNSTSGYHHPKYENCEISLNCDRLD